MTKLRLVLFVLASVVVSYNGPVLEVLRDVARETHAGIGQGRSPWFGTHDVGEQDDSGGADTRAGRGGVGHIAPNVSRMDGLQGDHICADANERDAGNVGLKRAQAAGATLAEYLASKRHPDYRWDIIGRWRARQGRTVTELEVKVVDCITQVAREKRNLRAEAEAQMLAPLIVKYADRWNVNVALLMAVLAHESGFDTKAVNRRTDDHGIAQINGLHLRYWDVPMAKAYQPEYGVKFAVRKLRADLDWARSRHPRHDPTKVALLAYNRGRGGATAVLRYNPVARYFAGGYVRSVERYENRFREAIPK